MNPPANACVRRPTAAVLLIALTAASTLGGCVRLDRINPWADAPERSRAPANAVAYQCKDRKGFHVRYDIAGKAAWVIYPEREFRLDPVEAASGARYSNGRTTLHTRGDEAFIEEAGSTVFADCKRASAG